MPHCQKEKHDHTAKSKKERQRKKEELLARKDAGKAQALEAEIEKAKSQPNNIAFAEGFGEYEVGCEPEKEYKAPTFNLNKRSKKVSSVTSTRYTHDPDSCLSCCNPLSCHMAYI